MDEVNRIISTLRKTFEKNAWHGPAVKEVLNDITAENAFKRLPGTHSIIELVAHMVSWRNFVIRRINGDDAFTVTDQLNFPAATDWEATCAELEKSQHELIQAIQTLPEEKLKDIVPHGEYKYTFYTLLHGIIHHDLYHTGQIMLVKKSIC
jgi:uncharacterized damage-inducible protein DinB